MSFLFFLFSFLTYTSGEAPRLLKSLFLQCSKFAFKEFIHGLITNTLCHVGSFFILAKDSMPFSVVMSFYFNHINSWWCIFNEAYHKWRWLLIVEDQKHWKAVELFSSNDSFSVSTDCLFDTRDGVFVPASKYLSVAFPAYRSTDLYVLLRETRPFDFCFAICLKYGCQTAHLHGL